MEIEVTMPTKIKIAKVRVSLPVRYDDEDIDYDFPLRTGKQWDAVIDIDTGKIEGWPADAGEQSMYMKVCDEGRYELLDEAGKVLFHRATSLTRSSRASTATTSSSTSLRTGPSRTGTSTSANWNTSSLKTAAGSGDPRRRTHPRLPRRLLVPSGPAAF